MSDIQSRLAAVREALPGFEVDALIITEDCNRRYVSGFTGSAGAAVITASTAQMLADSRYYEQVGRQAPDFEVVQVTARFHEALAAVLKGLGVQRVGFEGENLTVAELQRWQEALPDIAFRAVTGVVEKLRAVKAADELALIRRSAALTDAAMAHVQATIRPGQTEAEVAWSIERHLREHGAEGLAFAPIVGAGPNGALPHHTPGDHIIQPGEPIVVDIGARLRGYNSDLTRTFSLGPAQDPDYERVYAIVSQANRTAIAGLRPGITGIAADQLARDVIKDAGYGDYFGHSVGHGVGLAVHEGPRLSFLATDAPLPVGSVVTVEPGIYLPGRFGVRLEDLVVLHADRVEVLSASPTAPVVATP